MQRLSARADELAQTEPSGQALRQWLADVATRIGPYEGLPGAMLEAVTADGSPLAVPCAAMMNAGHDLLARAQSDGTVRPDVIWPDVFTAVAAISSMTTKSTPDARTRILDVYLDGLGVGL